MQNAYAEAGKISVAEKKVHKFRGVVKAGLPQSDKSVLVLFIAFAGKSDFEFLPLRCKFHRESPRIIILSSIFSVKNGRVDIVNAL
jgi:hypothetical protein